MGGPAQVPRLPGVSAASCPQGPPGEKQLFSRKLSGTGVARTRSAPSEPLPRAGRAFCPSGPPRPGADKARRWRPQPGPGGSCRSRASPLPVSTSTLQGERRDPYFRGENRGPERLMPCGETRSVQGRGSHLRGSRHGRAGGRQRDAHGVARGGVARGGVAHGGVARGRRAEG